MLRKGEFYQKRQIAITIFSNMKKLAQATSNNFFYKFQYLSRISPVGTSFQEIKSISRIFSNHSLRQPPVETFQGLLFVYHSMLQKRASWSLRFFLLSGGRDNNIALQEHRRWKRKILGYK